MTVNPLTDKKRAAPEPPRLGIRALARDATVYGGARVLLKSLAFLLVPLYAHYLSRREFGQLDTILASVAVVDVLISANMDGVFARFYFDRENATWRRGVITLYLVIEALYPAVIVGSLIAFAGPLARGPLNAPELAGFLVIALVDVYLTNIVDLPMMLSRLRRKPLTFAFYSITRGLIQILFSVLLVAVWHLGPKGILLASLISVCAAFVFTLPQYARDLTRSIPWRTGLEMVTFAWPGIVGGLAFYGLGLADRFIVRHYHGYGDVGLYGVAFRYSQIVAVAVLSFRFGWTQWHYSWLRSNRHPNMVARGASYYFFAIGLLTVIVSAWISPLFRIILPARFWDASQAVAPLCLAAVATGAYNVFSVGLNVTRRMRLLAPMALAGSAIAVGLYFALIPRFSYVGAAWATVGGFAALATLVLTVAQRIYPVPWDWRRITLAVGLCTALTLVTLAIDAWLPLLPSLPVRIAVTLAYPLALRAAGFFPADDRAAAYATLRKRLGRT
jgi:O-antigen/teichoic acid export membrane protein